MPSHTVLHVVITCLLLTLFSSAQPLEDELAKRTTCRASDTQITGLAQAIANPVSFCKWWLLVDRSRSPFSTLQYTAIDYACGCISDNPRLVTVKPSAPKASTNAVKLARDVAKPVPFCTFWTAMCVHIRGLYSFYTDSMTGPADQTLPSQTSPRMTYIPSVAKSLRRLHPDTRHLHRSPRLE